MVDHPIVIRLQSHRIMPVIDCTNPSVVVCAQDLMIAQGVGAFEVSFAIPQAGNVIRRLKKRSSELLVGAGSIVEPAQARAAIEAGADFVSGPCWVNEVAACLAANECAYIPGAMTAGEVLHHHKSGAALVRFPAGAAVNGLGMFARMRRDFPDVDFMASGDIPLRDVQDYLDAGARCAVIERNVIPERALEAGDIEAAIVHVSEALRALSFQPFNQTMEQ
nr:bifunctional 4-hydroxy-2-oxoglutarate aldolase/2-dehydro-3-deoxy-phosphogluconate aldolase [uncultured Cohaesibacter sp.]